MLNKVLYKNFTPAFKILYESRVKFGDSKGDLIVKEMLSKTVRSFRGKTDKSDPLEKKLKTFGNNGGWYRSRAKELLANLYLNKGVPDNFVGHWRSIEFELIFKSARDREDFGYLIRGLGLDKFVTIKKDISIKVMGGDPEKCIPNEVIISYRAGNEKVVYDFCKALKGRAYVNKTCGTHFHFDMRHLEAEEALVYGKRLARTVPALRLLLPKSRRDIKFCKANINTINSPEGEGRYAFVNMAAYVKYKTLEVRGHSGTINADKILNWIKLCESIMATDLKFISASYKYSDNPSIHTINDVSTIEELIKQYNFDERTINYINERYQKFNDKETEGEEQFDTIETSISKGLLEPQPTAGK